MANDFLTDNPELQALLQKYENAPDSHVFAPLADAYRKAGMLEEAKSICDQGVERHPRYPSGYVVKGKCYFDLGRLDTAEAAFQKVLDLDQNNLVALKYIGLILLDRGNEDRAMEHFKHILALDPDNKAIKDKLEDLEEDRGEQRRAPDKEFVGEPISLGEAGETSDDLATTTLADIYAEQGYTNKAKRIYREILKKQPDNERVRGKLAALEGEVPVADGETGRKTSSKTDAELVGDSSVEDSIFKTDKNGWIGNAPPDELEEATEGIDDEEDDEIALEEPRAVDSEDDEPKAAVAKTVEKKKPAKSVQKASVKNNPSPGERINSGKSYEQFKRWIKNISE